ncbi:nicotinate-nucleotide adenylyltransferase [Paenibacillus roseipurpureus]|uniref:Probable nicotinate-nucleotide adenylyltransferase n=1 Tax=Paenibacillus roseopurpureus TaxID=2918901 RepID=A0AA96LSB5_9BACL|nr:nicotinate-nucleotide adenylyltransferase [Paenibacillus sp. MBLB1832]WNR46336.1 nicotinate-nucleotide adenylyltransferase [Paenibacillus sp. MBLB1832]
MLVGIMGGTFDPIHTGHLIAAERARVEAGLDEVWIMPANTPPHKPNAPKATSQQRWEMVCLAAEGNPFFRPIDIEIGKGGVSYSIETIELLTSQYPDYTFFYIIGADMVQYLPQWHRIDDIVRQIQFIGLARPGYVLDVDLLAESIRNRVHIVPMPQVEISSTAIRALRQKQDPVRYLVPDKVRQFMEVNHLYES